MSDSNEKKENSAPPPRPNQVVEADESQKMEAGDVNEKSWVEVGKRKKSVQPGEIKKVRCQSFYAI